MTPADQISFERQVAAFLGSMAEELPGGRYTPPRPMLNRARVNMTVNLAAAALVAGAVIIGLMLAGRALIGGDGARPLTPLIGGSGALGRADEGASSVGVVIGGGYFGQGGYGPVSTLFDPPGGTRRGPDGGAWGPTARPSTGARGRDGAASREPGASDEGGGPKPWQPPPIGGSTGGGWGVVVPPITSGLGLGELPGGGTLGIHALEPREPEAARAGHGRSLGGARKPHRGSSDR